MLGFPEKAGMLALQIPAFSTMVFYFVRSGLNGDVSQWDRATQMPHYSATSMPSISVYTGLHLRQVAAAVYLES